MKKIFLLFCLVNLSFLVKSQLLKEPYYFIGTDEMHIYRQSNDTLYVSTAFSLESFNKKKYKSHYKIWSVKEIPQDILAVQLESLDTIPLTTDPYPEDRFKIFIYKKPSDKEIVLVRSINDLTKDKMINYNVDIIKVKSNFGMNLFSLSYMKQLLKFKKVTTKEDADKINNELNDPKYLTFAEEYMKQNKLRDPYATILLATLTNNACIKLGYSPIGARFSINILNSERKEGEKKKIIKEFYGHVIFEKNRVGK